MTEAVARPLQARLPLAIMLGSSVAALGILVLLAQRIFDLAAFSLSAGGFSAMKPNSAMGFAGLGLALVFSFGRRQSAAHAKAAVVCFSFTFMVASLTLFEHASGMVLGIDNLLVPNRLAALDATYGRPSVGTAITLSLVAIALWTLDLPRVGFVHISEVLSVIAVANSGFALVGYIYGAPTLYTMFASSTLPLLSSTAGVLSAIAALSLHRDRGISAFFAGQTLGGTMARRLTIFAVIIPVTAGAITVRHIHESPWGEPEIYALCTLAIMFAFVSFACAMGIRLDRVDHARREALNELKVLNASLEARVIERTGALNELNAQLRAEAEFRADAERQLADLIEAAPDGLVICSTEGVISRVNARIESMFGYERNELMGQSVEVLVPDSFRAKHVGHRSRFMLDPVARPMGIGLELNGKHKSGQLIAVDISLSVAHTTHGMFVVVAVRDIAARRALESQLKSQDALLSAMAETARDAMITVDAYDVIRFVNPAAEQMFSFGQKSMLGARSSEIFSVPLIEAFRNAQANAPFSRNVSVAMDAKRVGGLAFPVEVSLSEYTASGQRYHAAIVRDISERKATEDRIVELNSRLLRRNVELRELNSELEAYSYTISHDLRTPLRAIAGFSDILSAESAERLDANGRDKLERIRNAAQRMGQLFDDVLKLTRLRRADMHPRNIDLTAMAREIREELAGMNPGRNVSWSITPGMTARGDRDLIRMALANLLENAWKFTRDTGAPEISVTVNMTADGQVFTVRDNGAGFDTAYSNKLFKPFQRLHLNSAFPGTGIGLATVQRIIQRHGGKIWAESSVGHGAAFHFSLGDSVQQERAGNF